MILWANRTCSFLSPKPCIVFLSHLSTGNLLRSQPPELSGARRSNVLSRGLTSVSAPIRPVVRSSAAPDTTHEVHSIPMDCKCFLPITLSKSATCCWTQKYHRTLSHLATLLLREPRHVQACLRTKCTSMPSLRCRQVQTVTWVSV